MLPISRARATASLAALSLAALLVLPGVALADATSVETDAADATDAGPSQLPSTAAPRADAVMSERPAGPPADDDDTSDDTSDDAGGSTDGSTDGSTGDDDTTTFPAPVRDEAQPTACASHLVTFTRDGVDGDDTAVALTSQAVDLSQPGWLHVSWEAASGTELDAVELLHADGTRSALDATTTGTGYDVVELTFCGRADDNAGAHDPSDAAAQDAATDDAGMRDADAAVTPAPRTGDADGAGDTPVPPPATTAGNASAPSGDPASTAGTASGDEAEVEVLGVQIVVSERDAAPETDEGHDEPAAALAAAPALADATSSFGGMHPLLLAAAIAAGLAGAVTVLRATSRATSSSAIQGDPS